MSNKYSLNPVVIPKCYDNFPASFLLNARDVAQMLNYKRGQKSPLSHLIKTNKLPISGKNDMSLSGGMKNLFSLGDIRKLFHLGSIRWTMSN